MLLLLFSPPVGSDSLQSHGLQHTRPPCPSPSPGACPSSCPLHRWCHPAISSSVNLFSSCLQSFPASGLGKVNPHPNFQEMQYQRMVQTTGKLHSSPMLVRLCSKFCMLGSVKHAYVNKELPDVQAGFRKGRGTRDQIANIRWIIEKAREFQKITSASLTT